MKEKSAMEDKIFDFAQTKDALGQLSADLASLEAAIKVKQSALNNDRQIMSDKLQQREQQIADLSLAANDALAKIEEINKYIEGVL